MKVTCPINKDECSLKIQPKPKTSFLMIFSPERTTSEIKKNQDSIRDVLKEYNIELEIAIDRCNGKDFLCKICGQMQSVGIGILMYNKNIPIKTIANIFLECGFMYGLGKEIILIREEGLKKETPSDLISECRNINN